MHKVVLEAFESTNSKRFWLFLLSGWGSIVAILLFGKNFVGLNVVASCILGLLIVVAIWLGRFLFFLLKYSLKYLNSRYREIAYAESILILKDAFAKVHWLRKNSSVTDKDFKEAMLYLCDRLKEIFARLTRSTCSVSIKVAVKGTVTAIAEVANLSRDQESRARDTHAYKSVQHLIFKNTCFLQIFTNFTDGKKDKLFYVNNDIPADRSYQNTSREAYSDGKLPYDSEIVVPLIPLIRDEENNYNLLGFLCVDCKDRNKFDGKYHVGLLQGVADGIYDLMLQRIEAKGRQSNS